MRLSQSVTYAVQAALQLAESGARRPVPCCRLAAEGGMPERFLLQILRDLAKQGILHSTRGGGGGFVLDRDPSEVSLLELVEAIDGPLTGGLPARVCLSGETSDRLTEALAGIAEQTRRYLQAIRLSDLIVSGPTANLSIESANTSCGEPPICAA
jgi:Rrf2 family protein